MSDQLMRSVLAIGAALLALAAAAPAWSAAPAPGLVAAYAFDEGSGATAVDATGNGGNGAVVGAGWAAGRYGGALLFDGNDDYVGLPPLGTFYNTGFTLEAWVLKSTTKNDVGIVGTWTGSGPMLWIDHLATRYQLTLGGSLSSYLDSGINPSLGQWQHVAATFDGTMARYYVNGTEVASRTVSGSVGSSNTWRIGAYGSTPGGFFDGLVDEVRIYDRALSAAEIQSDRDQPLGVSDPGAPTAPGNLAVTATTKTTVSLGWTASTDDTGVSGYNVYVDGTVAGTTTATSFILSGLSCSTGYAVEVEAFDAAGNVSPHATVSASTAPCGATPGLVAAYAFDDGSGTTLADASGNGRTGTISGATWTTGRWGGALSFDGTNDHVSLASLGTFYNSGFTLEAWVRKATAKKDVGIVGTWSGSGPMLWIDHLAGRHYVTLGNSLNKYLDSGRAPTVGEWQHLAATFDGAVARYYLDGTQVASRTVSGNVGSANVWRIGAYGSSPGNFFDGLIDDVRIYDRALTPGEIQFDRDNPVTPPGVPADTTAPSAPGTLTATGGGQVSLSWGAATDNVGVVAYNVHRSTTSGFTPSASNRVAQPTGTTYTDSGLASGTYYYKVTAQDAAGNVGPPTNQASASTGDTTPPTVSLTAPAAGATVSGVTTISANASDDVGVAGVLFRVDGVNVGSEDVTAPYTVSWDTRGELNGSHSVTAVARDTSGNTRTSSTVAVTVANAGVDPNGLLVAYGLDETSGTQAADSSGNTYTATTVGTTWSAGRFGGGASFDGVGDRIDVPALGTFYSTGFTYEAWVRKASAKKDVAVLGTWTSAAGPMIWIDHISGRYHLTLGSGGFSTYLDSGRAPTIGQWEHVAATYDGSTARFYVDGVQVASKPFTGQLGSSNTWRLGAFDTSPTGFFDGELDNVRIYSRALSAAEIQLDMMSPVEQESIPPAVTATTPADGAAGAGVATSPTARFNEAMEASTITTSTFELRDAASTLVPATVTYDSATTTAKLTPQAALAYGASYTVTVKGGSGGVTDLAGNALEADLSWSFSTEASPPPVLVVTSATKPFGAYLGEILRNEGLNAFTTIDVAFLSPALLSGFDVVLLGEIALSAAQVSTLTGWVENGGNLVAMRPDKQLAGLLGLTVVSGTRSDAYLKVDATTAPGTGITTTTMQYHGTADNYSLSGATAVATLYAGADTATANPAVTLRTVGSSGGQAAAFTYDLARSVVYTRQGNPSWAGQERDGVSGIRPDDMFYSSWLNTNRVDIPQADEQQRLLVNLITLMNSDRMPLPRFWYLPRGEKAVVVMSGDDHSPGNSPGGTAFAFDRFKALSPAGCEVAKWECVRSTSYVYPDSVLTNTQAAAYVADGFEVALHPVVASCPTTSIPSSQLSQVFDTQLAAWQAKFTSVPAPRTSRTHCVYWPDWASNAKVELAHGIRMDANYYHYPAAWLGAKPGFMNGGGFPMRFADVDGTPIDVWQQNTNMNDEATTAYQTHIDTLLDNAVGAKGYYGAFGINMHTDNPNTHTGSEIIVAAAQARGVPVISYKQLLDWVDGRDGSTIRGLRWSAGTLTFVLTVAPGATGLQAMVPLQGPSGSLSAITTSGSAVPYEVQTIKGLDYAVFGASTATFEATYS